VEALKANPRSAADTMLDLFNKIWESEQVPEEWRKGYIIKFPKNGDLSDCQNWRGI
jgi:hypothetical protein